MEQRDDLDEDWKIVFAETNDLYLLREILTVLKNSNPEGTISLFNDILGLAEDLMFYEDYIESILHYYEAKVGFLFPQVMQFLDDNFYVYSQNDMMEYITNLLKEYNEEKMVILFSTGLRERLERFVPCLVGTGLFDTKDEDSIIGIINGIFIRYNPIPQIEGKCFEPITKITPRESNENIVPIQKVKKATNYVIIFLITI